MTKELKARLQVSLQDVRKGFENFSTIAGEDSFETTKLLAIQEALESIDGTLETAGTTEKTDKGYARMNLSSDTPIEGKELYEKALEIEQATGKPYREALQQARQELKKGGN